MKALYDLRDSKTFRLSVVHPIKHANAKETFMFRPTMWEVCVRYTHNVTDTLVSDVIYTLHVRYNLNMTYLLIVKR